MSPCHQVTGNKLDVKMFCWPWMPQVLWMNPLICHWLSLTIHTSCCSLKWVMIHLCKYFWLRSFFQWLFSSWVVHTMTTAGSSIHKWEREMGTVVVALHLHCIVISHAGKNAKKFIFLSPWVKKPFQSSLLSAPVWYWGCTILLRPQI